MTELRKMEFLKGQSTKKTKIFIALGLYLISINQISN